MKKLKFEKGLRYLSVGLLGISLFMNSYQGTDDFGGFFTLFFGALSFLVGIAAFGAWLANPILALSLFVKKDLEGKALLSGLAFALVFLAIQVKALPVHEGAGSLPVEIGLGFYFWISGIGINFLDAIIKLIKSKRVI